MSLTESNSSYNLDYWLQYYGSTWTIDSLFVFALTPISLLSFIMNILGFIVLSKNSFESATIFRYLRMYMLNSSVISLLLTTTFLFSSYRIFSFTNSYQSLFYGSYFHSPFLSIFYTFGGLLEICITIERALTFMPNRGLKKIINYKLFGLVLLVFSILINIPVFFVNYPGINDVILDTGLTQRFYYWGVTEFALSTSGIGITFALYSLRDVVSLIAKIVLNILTVHLIRKYFNRISSDLHADNSKSIDQIESRAQKSYITEVDRNLTYTGIIMCILSSLENVFVIVSYVLVSFQISYWLFFISYFTLAIKNFTNLFVLYSFNNFFREEFRKTFRFIYFF